MYVGSFKVNWTCLFKSVQRYRQVTHGIQLYRFLGTYYDYKKEFLIGPGGVVKIMVVNSVADVRALDCIEIIV